MKGYEVEFPGEASECGKNLDNCESLSKMEIAEKLILFNDWFWDFDEDRYIEENFDKKKFEKAWRDQNESLGSQF